MLIPYEIGGQVEAVPGMYVWATYHNAVCEIVFEEKDFWGDDCLRMASGELCGPTEVIAKWREGLVAVKESAR